ncbi:MAG: helix-turn-helix transcriptional regulator, partial [Aestuariivirga sp.]
MSTPRGKRGNGSQDADPTPALGKTIQRLRKAYNMSLGELSEQSGVAKSIISQIERNETNPTLSTVYRLSRALD